MRYFAMATLVAAFVLSGCATQSPLIEEQRSTILELTEEITDLQYQRDVLRDSLQFIDDIGSGQYYRDRLSLEDRINRLEFELAVCRDGGTLTMEEVATLRADDIFEPASATVTPRGRERLAEVARALTTGDGRTIRVEGHADSVPPGPTIRDQYPTNWELSAARASAVVRVLSDVTGRSADQFEVAAYGDSRPVATNNTGTGRAQNRRVVIGLL
jgi:chemotaxis protein MotB